MTHDLRPARLRPDAAARAPVRNLGVLAHVDAGKTTVTERILHLTGLTHRIGEVHDGAAVTDYDPQEQDRGITIFAAAVSCTWRGTTLTLVDTPGHVDFSVEVERSLRVLDGAVCVLDAVAGVQPQTEAVWRAADRRGVPRLVLVNKMDRPGADLDRAVATLQDRLGVRALVLQLPIGTGPEFAGVVDLLDRTALVWQGGLEPVSGPVPEELHVQVELRRERLVDELARQDETVLTAALEGDVAAEVLRDALRRATLAGTGVPVLCGAAYRNAGIQPLLDAVVDLLPSPVEAGAATGTWRGQAVVREPVEEAPLTALAFKVVHEQAGRLTFVRVWSGRMTRGATVLNTTTGARERVGRILGVHAALRTEQDVAVAGEIVAVLGLRGTGTGHTLCDPAEPVLLEAVQGREPVVSVAVEPVRAVDAERLAVALARLADEDPWLRVGVDEVTGRPLLSGQGELQLEVLVERVRRGTGIAVRTGSPRVAYRETVRTAVRGLVHRHVRQTGGPGQFAHLVVDVGPHDGDGFEFTDTVTGGRVPRHLVEAARAGMADALAQGPLGFPVTGVSAVLVDGGTHPKDSTEVAFRAAGRAAMSRALVLASPALLEPLVRVEVTVPDEYLGAVLGDMGRRRAQVLGTRPDGRAGVVTAIAPLAELLGWSTDLRSLSQGHAGVTQRPDGYGPVPDAVAVRVLGRGC